MKTINSFILLFLCVLHTVYGDSRCGTSWGDANGKCGTSCPDGTDASCPSGETCFGGLVDCGSINNNPAPQGNARCGTDWADANGKCGNSCPDGTDSSCPSGENCFTDLVNCEDIQQPGETECDADRECPLRACCSKWGFCGWTADFCNEECLGNCEIEVTPQSCDASQSMTVSFGYYASWSATRACDQVAPGNIDVSLYTHLCFSFAAVSEDFRLVPSSDTDIPAYEEFNGLKSKKPSLKTVIAVGGWAFNDPPTQHRFSNMASSQANRQVFIDSVLDFLRTYKFDGLDIDWEYPVADDRGGRPEDFKNYADLLDELRQAFDSTPEKFGLTIAVPLSFWYLRHFDLPRMHQAVDHMNIMSYDIHGIWDANIPSLGPYVKSHTNLTEIQEAFNMFFKNGVPPNKLVLGGASYGRTYTLQDPNCFDFNCPFVGPGNAGPCTQAPGTLSYSEIVSLLAEHPDATKVFDPHSASNYIAYGDQWISYDDAGAFGYKVTLAEANCFKGLMVWSTDMVTEDIGLTIHSLMSKALEQAQALPVESSPKLRFNDMIYISTHNAFTNYQDGRWTSVAQSMSIANQLKNGVRSLMLDTHYEEHGFWDWANVIPESGVWLLHGVNERGWVAGITFAQPSKRLSSALDDVINFLKDNDKEIVTVFLEDYTETDRLKDELDRVSDLRTYLYDPDNDENWKVPDEKQWPTLEDLLNWNKRLLIFSSKNHDNTESKIGVPYDWKYTKQNYWSIGGLGNNYDCPSRWNNDEYIDADYPKLFVMNHYRDVPTVITAAIDNTKDNILKRARDYCREAVGQLPNFVAVDFFEVPDNAVMDAINELRVELVECNAGSCE